MISLTSKRADTRQGVAMGLNNSFNSLGRIVGPIWAGFAFDLNYSLPYLSGALIMFVGFVISLIWLPQQEVATGAGDQSAPRTAATPQAETQAGQRARQAG